MSLPNGIRARASSTLRSQKSRNKISADVDDDNKSIDSDDDFVDASEGEDFGVSSNLSNRISNHSAEDPTSTTSFGSGRVRSQRPLSRQASHIARTRHHRANSNAKAASSSSDSEAENMATKSSSSANAISTPREKPARERPASWSRTSTTAKERASVSSTTSSIPTPKDGVAPLPRFTKRFSTQLPPPVAPRRSSLHAFSDSSFTPPTITLSSVNEEQQEIKETKPAIDESPTLTSASILPGEYLARKNFHSRVEVVPSAVNGKQYVSYSTVGDPNGLPVLILMGLGANRVFASTFHDIAVKNGLRIVWPDRPGIGKSTPIPTFLRVSNFPNIVASLAKKLKISKFTVIAQSCGTIYALAIAKKYPDLIKQPLLIASPWVPTAHSNTFAWTKILPDFALRNTYLFPRQVPKPFQGIFNFSFSGAMTVPSYSGLNETRSMDDFAIEKTHSRHSRDSLALRRTASNRPSLRSQKSFNGPAVPANAETSLRQACEAIATSESRKGESEDVLVCLGRGGDWSSLYLDAPEMLVWYGQLDNMVTESGIKWLKETTKAKVKTLKWLSHGQVVEVSWVLKDLFKVTRRVALSQDPGFKEGLESLDDFGETDEEYEILPTTLVGLGVQ